MDFSKKNWLFHLLAFVVIVVLVRANCGHKTVPQKPPDIECQKIVKVVEKNNVCVANATNSGNINAELQNKQDAAGNEDGLEEVQNKQDAAGNEDGPECKSENDCDCGYRCVDNRCRKLDFSCCADEDCKTGDFCSKNSYGKNGMCLRAECWNDNECGRCGMYCKDHVCVDEGCCTDADCPTGMFCMLSGDETEGFCLTSHCASNADCDCGRTCNNLHRCSHGCVSSESCCGKDYCYDERCWPHEAIEDGRCLEDANCPLDKVCVNWKCLPTTCANNADCGCEAVCRKGHCEWGCDDNNGCCNQGDTCDRGECKNPNEEESSE